MTVAETVLSRLGRGPATFVDLLAACPSRCDLLHELACMLNDRRIEIVPSGEPGVSLYVLAVPVPAKRAKRTKPVDTRTPARKAWDDAIANHRKKK